MFTAKLISTITCPVCGRQAAKTMPADPGSAGA